MRRARSKRVTGSSVCTTASAVCRPTPGWVRSRTTRGSAAARVASSWLTAAICASNVVSNLRLLPLGGIGSAQGQSRELLLPSHGEQPEAQPQLVIEGHGLQPVLHHGA